MIMPPRTRALASLLLCSLLIIETACNNNPLTSRNDGAGGSGVSGNARPAPQFKPGFNLFSPEQDIQMGRQSAQQIAQESPLLRDQQTVNYIRALGAKLVAKAPGHKFPYQFNVIATKEINAFALPGGFIFVNAGAIAAAKNEGELAGVIGHEIMHVALRHGTNQASKAYLAKAGLGVLQKIAGGASPDLEQAVRTIGGTGANMLFLKFGRAAETEADIGGARILAEAGYDPRDMANFFKTIQARSGQRTPEILSDHPDPGNRYAQINDLARSLPVARNPTHTTAEFEQVKAGLTGGSRSSARGELRDSAEPNRTGPSDPNNMPAGTRPQPPAGQFRDFAAQDGSFAFKHPVNWDVLAADESNMIVSPQGAYGQIDRSVVVTHGVFIGATQPASTDLAQANNQFVRRQLEANPDFRVARQPERIDFGGRAGYATVISGPSAITGVSEINVVYTTATSDGRLFYFITICPEDEFQTYQRAFQEMSNSLRVR